MYQLDTGDVLNDEEGWLWCNLLIDLLCLEIMKSESNFCLQFDSYMFQYSVSAFLCNWWDLILRWNIYCESLVEFLHLHQPTIINFLSLVTLENLTFFQRQELQKIYFSWNHLLSSYLSKSEHFSYEYNIFFPDYLWCRTIESK